MIIKHSELKNRRTVNFFLDAAKKIADRVGIENLSIRNVSDEAGYNSATLYNYFDNFEQLVAFVVIRDMAEYLNDSIKILNNITDPFNDYICLWKTYCDHSFESPSIFTYAYASSESEMNNIQKHTKAYFETYLDVDSNDVSAEDNAYFAEDYRDVNDRIRRRFVKAGLFSEENSKQVIEFGHFLYLGVLRDAQTRGERTASEYTDVFMKYFIPFLKQNTAGNSDS